MAAMAQTKENIILCGFMGCGKSTVGKKLSKLMDLDFVDMDDYICLLYTSRCV